MTSDVVECVGGCCKDRHVRMQARYVEQLQQVGAESQSGRMDHPAGEGLQVWELLEGRPEQEMAAEDCGRAGMADRIHSRIEPSSPGRWQGPSCTRRESIC